MSAGQTATVVLLAVLVGAAIPVFVQLFLTLGRLRHLIDSVESRLEPTLDEIAETARRLNRLGAGLEETVGSFNESVTKLRRVVRTAANIGAAVGPAVVAAARAFTSSDKGGASGRRDDAELAAKCDPFLEREEAFDEQQ
jgi:hypothetical protein